MHSLFIDSTFGLIVGLLDSNYSWLEYLTLNEKRPSELIHFEIFSLLQKYNLKLKEIECFIASGPGSYTGMRLSEGIVQVFELEKIPVYSFYHFDVPRFCGEDEGVWVTNAFKGQIFVSEWKVCGERVQINKKLVNKSDFLKDNDKKYYSLDSSDVQFNDFLTTKDLIKKNSKVLFKAIKEKNLREKPFYFRSLEEEFSTVC